MKRFNKAIKNWFLDNEHLSVLTMSKNELYIKKETEKAIMITFKREDNQSFEKWIPKSCICDKWEISNFAYHDYLVSVSKKAYENDELFEKHIITSGCNRYKGDAFIHQESTKKLIERLDRYNVKYMSKKELEDSIN